MSQRRFIFCALAAAVGVLGSTGSALADSAFPSKPIRFIIPTAPGGNLDLLARVIGGKLAEAWGQPVVVEGRPGANTILATTAVAKAPADGYTALFTISGFVQNLALQPNPQYRVSDFVPTSQIASFPIALAANATLPANDLKGLVQLAKQAPEKLSFGSYGTGSAGHIIGEGLNKAAGVKIKHIAYKGESASFVDLAGGQIDLAYGSMGLYGRQLSAGKVKILAVASTQRLKQFPDVQTFAEAGYSDINLPGWGGLFLPAGTPAVVIEKFSQEIRKIVAMPDVQAKIYEMGFEPQGSPSKAFAAVVEADVKAWGKIVRENNITLN